jgi:hypothetical protein
MDAADFLFAFDEELDIERQLPLLFQVRLDGLDVHEHLALVVGRSARVDLAVANGRLERRRRPLVERIHRLHVIVAVEQDRRCTGRAQPVAVDDGVAGRVDQADVLHADALQFLRRPLGTAAHVAGVLRQRADAGDREVLLQLVDVAIAVHVDEINHAFHDPRS